MKELQSRKEKAEWISWHEGAHLHLKLQKDVRYMKKSLLDCVNILRLTPRRMQVQGLICIGIVKIGNHFIMIQPSTMMIELKHKISQSVQALVLHLD